MSLQCSNYGGLTESVKEQPVNPEKVKSEKFY